MKDIKICDQNFLIDFEIIFEKWVIEEYFNNIYNYFGVLTCTYSIGTEGRFFNDLKAVPGMILSQSCGAYKLLLHRNPIEVISFGKF